VQSTEGIINPCSNGPTDVFFISCDNFHGRSPERDTALPIGDLQCFESAVSAFVPNVSAQILCTHTRDHKLLPFCAAA
jgi:hypothetical protein